MSGCKSNTGLPEGEILVKYIIPAMSVKKLGKLTSPKTTGPVGVVGAVHSDEMRWKAQDALRTIHAAEGHKKDRELMKHVKKMAKEQAKACGVK